MENDHLIKPNLTACDQAGLVYKPGSRRLGGLEILTDAENLKGFKLIANDEQESAMIRK